MDGHGRDGMHAGLNVSCIRGATSELQAGLDWGGNQPGKRRTRREEKGDNTTFVLDIHTDTRRPRATHSEGEGGNHPTSIGYGTYEIHAHVYNLYMHALDPSMRVSLSLA